MRRPDSHGHHPITELGDGEARDHAATVGQLEDAVEGLLTRSATLFAPVVDDTVTLFRAQEAINIAGIAGVVGAASTSVTVQLKTSPDRSDENVTPFAQVLLDSNTTGDSFPLNVDVPAGNWVWMYVFAVSGAPLHVHVTLTVQQAQV